MGASDCKSLRLRSFFCSPVWTFLRDKPSRTSALTLRFDRCSSSPRKVLSSFASSVVTHCIASTTVDETGDYTTNRTVKYLLSILTHKPIISFDWITEIDAIVNSCISKDQQTKHSDIVTTLVSVEQFPSWKPYTVKGDCQMAHCTKGGPDRSWSSPKV